MNNHTQRRQASALHRLCVVTVIALAGCGGGGGNPPPPPPASVTQTISAAAGGTIVERHASGKAPCYPADGDFGSPRLNLGSEADELATHAEGDDSGKARQHRVGNVGFDKLIVGVGSVAVFAAVVLGDSLAIALEALSPRVRSPISHFRSTYSILTAHFHSPQSPG